MNEIEKIASIINKRVGTDEGCVVGYKHNRKIITTVDTKVIAKYLIEAGYGDTKQAIIEFADKFKDKWIMELKPLAWEYGQGAEDVLRIFDETLAEVTGK